MFRFYVDNTLLDQHPDGWADFTSTISRSEIDRFLFVEHDTDLVFRKNAGWDQIYPYITGNNYGKLIPFRAEYTENEGSTWNEIFEGYIDVSEVEVDLQYRTIKGQIADNSLGTLINKNRSLKVSSGTTSSKNGTTITKLSPAAKTFTLTTKQGVNSRSMLVFEWDDIITNLIDYITDGTISVVNNFYTGLTEKLYMTPLSNLIRGVKTEELKTNYEARPEREPIMTTSLNEAFLDVGKLFNLWMVVIYDSGSHKITIEEEADIYTTTDAITVSTIRTKLLRINSERFFTSVQLGEEEVDNGGVFYAAASSLYGWRLTEIQLKGNTNIRESILDLTVGLIYSGVSIALYGLRIDVTDTGESADYVLSYNTRGSGSKNVLLQGTASTIAETTLNEEGFIAQADELASAADVTAIGETEILSDDVNIEAQSAMINQILTNDEILARYNLPFDTFVSTNPTPSVDVTLVLNADITGLSETKLLQFGLNETDHLFPLRSDVGTGEDNYNQWSNTEYRFTPAALSGRIDEYTISGSVRVNVSSFTDEGFRVVLFASRILNGVLYRDQLAQSSVSTSTGTQTLSLTGRRYVPFTSDESFRLLVACVPEGENYVNSNDWSAWTYNLTHFADNGSGTLSADETGDSGFTDSVVNFTALIENGAQFRVQFDYDGQLVSSVKVVTGSTVHFTEIIAGSGSFDEVITADDTDFELRISVDPDATLDISNFRLTKYYTCNYSVLQTGTEITISQEGFNGTVITSASAATFKGWELEFEGSCKISEWKALMDDPRKRVTVDGVSGWAKALTYNYQTGSLRGVLITDFNNLGL